MSVTWGLGARRLGLWPFGDFWLEYQIFFRPYLRKCITWTFDIFMIFPYSFIAVAKVDSMLQLGASNRPAVDQDKASVSLKLVGYIKCSSQVLQCSPG